MVYDKTLTWIMLSGMLQYRLRGAHACCLTQANHLYRVAQI